MHLSLPLRWLLPALLPLLACFLAVSPARADDDTARIALNRAQSMLNSGGQVKLELATTTLMDAYEEAESTSLRNSIESALRKAVRAYDDWLRRCMPLFLDAPEEDREEFYRTRARYGSAQGQRQYGELLIEQGNDEGWTYVEKAAEQNEPRALFLMAERYRHARGGVEQSGSSAFIYLLRSATGGYAPAHELLAKGFWDGDGTTGCPWDQNAAMVHLNTAINLYAAWRLGDAAEHRGLQDMLQFLRNSLVHMSNISSGKAMLPANFYPSYDALLMLSLSSESEAGLRARLYYICLEMEGFGGTCLTDHFDNTRLEYVPITIGSIAEKNVLGYCTSNYDEPGAYSYSIKIDISKLPPAAQPGDEMASWYNKNFTREAALTNILAHELAHGLFRSRYPGLAEFSDEDRWLTYEGHATNSAFAVVRRMYHYLSNHSLTHEQYAARYCDSEYRRAFYWFLNNCISPSGRAFWDKLDHWERSCSGGSAEPARLMQQAYGGRVFWKPTYFGRAYFGYL